jgi:hypothetical protein
MVMMVYVLRNEDAVRDHAHVFVILLTVCYEMRARLLVTLVQSSFLCLFL